MRQLDYPSWPDVTQQQSGSTILVRHDVAPPSKVATGRRPRSSQGFTLVELLIVMTILPLIIGALSVSLIAVLSLQPKISHGLGDASNAQVVSANFERDVQSATNITTASSPQCGSGFQLLGLETKDALNNVTYISYVRVATATGYTLERLTCPSGSSVPKSSSVVASEIPSTTPPTTPTLNCASTVTNCADAPTQWTSTSGVTSVAVAIPVNSGTPFSLAAAPVLWNSNGAGTPGGSVPGGGSPLFPFVSYNASASNCSALSMDGATLNVGSSPEPLKIDSTCADSVNLQRESVLNASELVTPIPGHSLDSYSASRSSTPATGGLSEVALAAWVDPLASATS